MFTAESETAEALNPGRFDVQADEGSKHDPRNPNGCRSYSTFAAHLESTFPFSDCVTEQNRTRAGWKATAYGRRQANEPDPRSSWTCERATSRPDDTRRDANGPNTKAGHSAFSESAERQGTSRVGFTTFWRGQQINEHRDSATASQGIAGNRGRLSQGIESRPGSQRDDL